MLSIMRTVAIVLSAAFLLPMLAPAQLVEDLSSGRGNCCLAGTAQTLATQLLDWNQFGRYHADNEKLKAQPADPGRVVFMGDSITDGWRLEQYFPGKPYVNRGISGQTTPQMLVRMFEDVIDLKPAAVIIFAGTNDIARNTGPETIGMVEENFEAMTELAQAHGIKVILCSLTPVSDYGPTKMTVGRPPADILKLNAWLKEYAARAHSVLCRLFQCHRRRERHAERGLFAGRTAPQRQGLRVDGAGGRGGDSAGVGQVAIGAGRRTASAGKVLAGMIASEKSHAFFGSGGAPVVRRGALLGVSRSSANFPGAAYRSAGFCSIAQLTTRRNSRGTGDMSGFMNEPLVHHREWIHAVEGRGSGQHLVRG